VIRVIRESLLTLGAGAADAVRRLSDDVTGLQRKLDEMRARVERVEASGEIPTSMFARRRGTKCASPAPRPAAPAKAAPRRKPAAAKSKTSKRAAPTAASRRKKKARKA
jgi:hypothetical protein